ncbi:hypothetical protein BD289DRAFT_452035 [Coniella lustricola]|uniref:Uncharacterized protein n=1 Tax=Coniella lustricola TaxID=2025994 RepID=A0A2T3ACR8_9PEZI|nr:hypothetical protein BD289DRAFT_452035 [Coniella lustricola]
MSMASPSQLKGSGAADTIKNHKPLLSIDTQTATDLRARTVTGNIRSAPVGTRLDRGIPPMFKAVDLHCAKVASIMDPGSWGAQHFDEATHVKMPITDYGDVSETLSDGTENSECDQVHHNREHSDFCPLQIMESNDSFPIATGHIHLGVDKEDVEIVGIHPYARLPETSNDTMIISVRVSRTCDFLDRAAVIDRPRKNNRQRRVDEWTGLDDQFGRLAHIQQDDVFGVQPTSVQSLGPGDDSTDPVSKSIHTQWRNPDGSVTKPSNLHKGSQISSQNAKSAVYKTSVTLEERRRFEDLLDRLRANPAKNNSTETSLSHCQRILIGQGE